MKDLFLANEDPNHISKLRLEPDGITGLFGSHQPAELGYTILIAMPIEKSERRQSTGVTTWTDYKKQLRTIAAN